MKLEVWKDIENYPNYQVSSFGNVKSKPRKGTHGGILKQEVNKYGYCKVLLLNNNKRLSASVHRLVAQAFIPNPSNLPQVNHIDGNKLNNHTDNLEWCTPKDNVRHRFEVLKQKHYRKYDIYDWNDKESIKEYHKNYQKSNKEKIAKYQREYYQKKKEQFEQMEYKVGE